MTIPASRVTEQDIIKCLRQRPMDVLVGCDISETSKKDYYCLKNNYCLKKNYSLPVLISGLHNAHSIFHPFRLKISANKGCSCHHDLVTNRLSFIYVQRLDKTNFSKVGTSRLKHHERNFSYKPGFHSYSNCVNKSF